MFTSRTESLSIPCSCSLLSIKYPHTIIDSTVMGQGGDNKWIFGRAVEDAGMIAIPNNTKINAIAWNKEDGYIAVGGDDGLLKVLKLDSGGETESGTKARGLAASSNLSMNQTLEGHTEAIQVLVWNETHKKLTTSDQNGVIIVWMLYKGSWYEEMINNRKKSTVVGMAWSSDGLKICIIYEDGAVIVGSVDGNRIWGKEIKGVQLSGVQWSPDGKLLLFSLKTGQLHLYDNQGNFAMILENHCLEDSEAVPIVGLDWYNGKHGYMHALCPNLAICYEDGRTQLMCNENDTRPIVVATEMFAVDCSWNHNGSLLAIAGKQFGEDRDTNLVQFYTPFGEHLRTLKVPGNSITRCVWEGGSLRVALAVDSFVYFANIRPDYKWCYFKKTVVFTSCKAQKTGICVSFWDMTNNQCHTRYVSVVLAIAGYGDHCVIATLSDSFDAAGRFGLLLCNTSGTPVDGKYIDMDTFFVTMNASHVIAASKNNFLLWQYKTPKAAVSGNRPKCRMFHIDDNPTAAAEVIQDLGETSEVNVNKHRSLDPISCLACSDKCLIIGRESGLLQYYALPHVVLVNRYRISLRPHKMAINCNSTRLSVIDVAGVMTVIDISDGVGRSTVSNDGNKLERKDVWAMCWASDNPQLLAIMEKTRMYIFKGIYPEEPMSCSGYICSFNDLEIQAVLLDEVMESPERPSKDHVIKLEVKSLRDTRQLLEKVGINEAAQFIEDNPHPRLWRLLAEAALKEINLTVAESAFVRSQDYSRVLFVKRLKEVSNEFIRKAHVAIYFKNFDEAEKIYIEADRSDLALQLRQTLGDWFRVIQILKNGGITAPDNLLQTAYNSTADYFVHFNNWASAVEYYELANNKSEMVECYYHLEDYNSLESFIDILPEGDPLLEKIADIFAADAVHNLAVDAYVKFGNVKAAINLCIQHNRWDTALSLAKKYNITKISDLLMKYTSHLIEKGLYMEAIEVNEQAAFYLHAAEQAFEIAQKAAKRPDKNLLLVKEHYVYAARFLELHKKNPNSDEWPTKDLLLEENSWEGAEAYHFYMLAQDQLYKGKLHDAMCTAYKLQDYSGYISDVEIYSLLALTSCLHRAFGICSRAFIKLKSLTNVSAVEHNQFVQLSWEIFSKNEPVDLKQSKVKCSNCQTKISDWNTSCPNCHVGFPTCIATGKSITDEATAVWICRTCHHRTYDGLMNFQKACLLCHDSVG